MVPDGLLRWLPRNPQSKEMFLPLPLISLLLEDLDQYLLPLLCLLVLPQDWDGITPQLHLERFVRLSKGSQSDAR